MPDISHFQSSALKPFRYSSRYRALADKAEPLSVSGQLKKLTIFLISLFVCSSLLLVLGLRFLSPPTSAFMLHQHIDDLVEGDGFRHIQQQWVASSGISRHAFNAVIASEDQLFYQHFGFDLQAIYRAYRHNQRGGSTRGASTISQQVAKNLFLSPARNYGRKALEIWFTLLIEVLWSKQRILEMYLNIAEFGDHVFGVEAASRRYFGIPAKQLSASQAALLVATLPNPARLQADHPTAYLFRRQQWILRQMRNLQ